MYIEKGVFDLCCWGLSITGLTNKREYSDSETGPVHIRVGLSWARTINKNICEVAKWLSVSGSGVVGRVE